MNITQSDETAPTPNPEPLESDTFVIRTSQEVDALGRATASGKTYAGYESDAQAGAVTFSQKQLSHFVRLELTPDEVTAGVGVDTLESLARAQDSDAVLAQLYILSVLAPIGPVPANLAPTGKIDIDDVIEKIGWDPRSTAQREEMRARVWEFIKYGARAKIIGQRSVPYRDRHTKEVINTSLVDPAWHLGTPQTPEQRSLGFSPEVPVSIELFLSKSLTALITSPYTSQYLPLGEVLGAIPGGKPAGAWARVIGLSLASFWRRCPRQALSGEIKPTRRELLDHFPAKVSPYQDLFSGKDAARAIGYWCGAIAILREAGLVAGEGEALRTEKEIRSSLPGQNWSDKWLNEAVYLVPGGEMREHVSRREKSLPEAPVKRRPGRPRKTI